MGSDLIQDGSIKYEDLAHAVNAHNGKEPKIYRLSNFKSNFQEIDYTILNLFPKRFFIQGELQKVEWYIDNELTDLALTVLIEYVRDSIGFATSRTVTRTWINNDGSENIHKKYSYKDYTINDGESIQEGKKRRTALVDNIEKPVLRSMYELLLPQGWSSTEVILSGRRFLDEYDWEFGKFIKNSSTVTDKSSPDYGRKKVIVKIENETDSEFIQWLDTAVLSLGGFTIREFLIEEFNI